MEPTPAIETHELRKIFGDNTAVKGLTLQVQQGEVFGFLGPNGAGKTTSIKMLLGLITPTAGTANLLGVPVGDIEARGKIGFLPEHFRFHEWLNAGEFLSMHGQLYGMQGNVLTQRVKDLLDLVGLTPFRKKLLHTFSKGMLQRIGLAQALLNEPSLVFLDEPTSGLDPVGRLLVRDIIHNLRKQGTTVFLNSHLLSEIEVTCDRVAFIKHGEVIKTSELGTFEDGRIKVAIRAAGVNPIILEGLGKLGSEIRLDGEYLSLIVHNDADLPEVNRFLVDQGASVYSITPQHISLEDMFMEIIGKDDSL
jgi:ABC-2 type transport system ATP-binding protein